MTFVVNLDRHRLQEAAPRCRGFRYSSFLALLLSSAGAAWAGSYTLIRGAGNEVCEAYRRNFEPRHDVEPMVCEREYNPKIPGFSRPKWRRIDINAHVPVYRKALRYMYENDDSPTGTKLTPDDVDHATSDHTVRIMITGSLAPEMYVTRMRLKAHSPLSTVLALVEHRCSDTFPRRPLTSLFVVNSAVTDLDYPTQEKWGWLNNTTLVLFKGEPFLEHYGPEDNWGHVFTGSGQLYVRPARLDRSDGPYCTLRWEPDQSSGKP